MKALNQNFKSLILTVGFILISINLFAQDNRLTREDIKAARKEQQYLSFQIIDSMLQNRSFVLKANWLETQYGNRLPVLSGINFILVDSTRAVLQTGSNSIRGYNGLGGTTAEGNISGLKITKNVKTLSFFLRFTVTTNIGIYDIAMSISSNRFARATITGLTPGKLIYDGEIETIYNSGIYKGQNSI